MIFQQFYSRLLQDIGSLFSILNWSMLIGKRASFLKYLLRDLNKILQPIFLKYKGFISKILLWDADRTNVSFYFYSWKETICWMENIFWKFSIHKEIFALKADCVNFFKSIKLIGKYFVGLTWKKILWDNVPTIFM